MPNNVINMFLPAQTTAPFTSAYHSTDKRPMRTHQGSVVGTGAVSATIIFEGSNDALNWVPINTFTLTGTGSATDGFVSNAAWKHTRARLTAISGTNAAASAQIGF